MINSLVFFFALFMSLTFLLALLGEIRNKIAFNSTVKSGLAAILFWTILFYLLSQ
jgi:hypothetical protein